MAGKQAVYDVFTRFRIDARGWDKSLNRVSRSLDRVGKKMSRAGENLTRSLTLPLALAGGAAVKFAIDLEQSFAKIQNLVGISTETLKGFTQEVRRISDTTGEAQKSLADALFVVTSAGAEGAEAIQILEQAAKASAAGLGVTADIARTVTAALTAYGKENLSAARATDIMFATVRQGNLEAESLAASLGPVLGLSAKLGVSFAEVGANIATFTRLGVSAEQAATSLQAIFSTFLKPTDGAKKALAEFGLTAQQVRDKIAKDGLADTLINLVDRVGDNDEALAQIIPNIRALRGVLGTAGVQTESYADILRKVADSAGLVNQGFENVSQTAGQKFKVALTNLQNVAIELGNVLIPIVVRVVESITGLIDRFKALPDSTKQTIVQIGLVVAAIGPLLLIFGKVVSALAVVVKLFRTAAIAAGLANVQFLLIVGAFITLAALIFTVAKNWDAIKERISDIGWWRNTIIEMIQFLIEFNPFGLLIKGYNALIEKLGGTPLPDPFSALAGTLDNLKVEQKKYENDFVPFIDLIKDKLTDAKKAISDFFQGGGTATPIAEGVGTSTQGAGTAGLTGLNQGPSIFEGVGDTLDVITPKFDYLNSVILQTQLAIAAATEKKKQWAETITGVLTSAFDGLGNAIISGFESGKGALASFGQFFVEFAKGLLAKMISLIATAVILSTVLSTIGFGIGAAGGVSKGIGIAKSIGNLLKGGITSLAIGTDFVNRDGLAMLHKGEQVVPANVSGGGFTGGMLVADTRIKAGDIWLAWHEEERKRGNTA